MARKKNKQFADNALNPLFFQPYYHELQKGFALKGFWHEKFFLNTKPICLELGCGKGEYTYGLALKYPDKNFIGVDLKGARMWKGASDARKDGLKNVAFVRSKIELLEHFFGAEEISEIWLTFSDPQPKYERRRLSSPRFLNLYHNILKPKALIHVKTDNTDLFNYTLSVIKHFDLPLHYSTEDLYASDYEGDASEIQTFYEKKYLAEGTPIKYLRFSLNERFKNNTLEKLPKEED
jgi:tRNA (guanine-N7-)-methyltransferase